MKRWLVLITLLGMVIFPTNSSAEQSSKYLIHSTVSDIQKMMKQENVTASFELLPIVELELTPSELLLIKQSYPNASVSLVQEYEIAAYTDKIPAQFPMIKTAPTQTVPYTGKGVKVGVLDTGIDVDHPDLNVAGGICTMDIQNCSSGTSYDDDNGHGTHVAGIIAALQNNQGIVGIAPNVELYAIKSLGRGGSSSTIIAKGIEWAINNNIDILNLSITTTLGPDIMQKFIEAAYDSGMIIVGAAGNEGATRGVQYPALYEDVIAISSVNLEKKITATSSTGEKIELAAPGFEITSTYPLDRYAEGKGYATLSGTSMAAPHVTGIAALYKERFPSFSNSKIRELLTSRSEDLGPIGRDIQYGFGLVQYQNNIDDIPFLNYELSKGKITINLQNKENVKSIELSFNGEVIAPKSLGVWEVYQVAGSHKVIADYVETTGKIHQDIFNIDVIEPKFTDISPSLWYSSHIAYLGYNNIIYGKTDGSFQPNVQITRGEAVALLGRALGLNGEPRQTKFKDVGSGFFASGYIQSAYDSGYVRGFPDGTFRPSQPVTRAEMAILMAKMYELPFDESIPNRFNDINPEMMSYESIRALGESGITLGYPDGTFQANQHMTRFSFSVFVARAEEPNMFK
jgi:hypothetical protein